MAHHSDRISRFGEKGEEGGHPTVSWRFYLQEVSAATYLNDLDRHVRQQVLEAMGAFFQKFCKMRLLFAKLSFSKSHMVLVFQAWNVVDMYRMGKNGCNHVKGSSPTPTLCNQHKQG